MWNFPKLTNPCFSVDDTLKLTEIEGSKQLHEAKDLDCSFRHTSCGYSPDGKLIYTTTSKRERKGKDSGSLLFFDSETFELQYRIEYQDFGAVACIWHPKLNQILVGFSDGNCKIYYDTKTSVRGALLCSTKPVKRSQANEVIKQDIIISRKSI